MMIIDVVDKDAVAMRDKEIAYLQEEIQSRSRATRLGLHTHSGLRAAKRRLEIVLAEPVKPNSYYASGSLTAYQVHAVQGTQWPTKVEKPVKTLVAAIAVVVSFGMCLGATAGGGLGLALAAIAVCAAGCVALAFDDIEAQYRNTRIKRTKTDDIMMYKLDSRLTNGLRLSLEMDLWNRTVEALRANDPEISAVFTTFCTGRTKYMELIDRAEKLLDANESLENGERIDSINRAAQDFTKRTTSEISEIFAKRDVEAQVALQRALEAKTRAQEKEEYRAFVESVERSMSEPIQGNLIDADLEIIEAKY
jgi:hypothetical protein